MRDEALVREIHQTVSRFLKMAFTSLRSGLPREVGYFETLAAIKMRLVDTSLSFAQLGALEPDIAALAQRILDGFDQALQEPLDDDIWEDIEFQALCEMAQFIDVASNPALAFALRDSFALSYEKLRTTFAHQLKERLTTQGMSTAEADRLAIAVVSDFEATSPFASALRDQQQTETLLDTIASTVRVVRSATQGFQPVSYPVLRPLPPIRWVERNPEEFPTAESFLRHHFGPRLGIDGDLTQASLAKIDSRLMAALDAEFRGERRAELRKLLPTTKERNDALLLRTYGYVPEGEDRKKKVTVLARHKP